MPDKFVYPLDVYFAIDSISSEYLDRWGDEAYAAYVLRTTHPNSSRCASARAKEARDAYFISKSIQRKLETAVLKEKV